MQSMQSMATENIVKRIERLGQIQSCLEPYDLSLYTSGSSQRCFCLHPFF